MLSPSNHTVCRKLALIGSLWLKVAFATSLVLVISACASTGNDALFGGNEVDKNGARWSSNDRNGGATLGDLKEVEIDIQQQTLAPTTAERVLASYREALALFTSDEQRQRALRRMADLTMVATEDRLVADDADADLQEENPQLYFDSIGDVAAAGELINYDEAIRIYQELIAKPETTSNLPEVHYLLAKAQDLNADQEASLATLDKLVNDFTFSPFHYEAQFRRGEILYAQGEYDLADAAYEDIIQAEQKTAFHENALYKIGWARYKTGDYASSVAAFMRLLDDLNEAEQDRSALSNIKADAYRAASLSFASIKGAETMEAFFTETGRRNYENEIYKALAALYLRREQHLDAAETYETFVKQNPQHQDAPVFTAAVMDAYKKGNFNSLVLPAKEKFVASYGVNSAYWKKATPEQRAAYKSELKLHLIELAQHHHARAQKTQAPADFNHASIWYREFLQTFSNDIDAPMMNKLLAETLFSAKGFLAAAKEFETTAYSYPLFEQADEAGYFALVAYQELLASFEGKESQQEFWINKRLRSAEDFAHAFPTHPKAAQILHTAKEDYLVLENLPKAIITAQAILKLEQDIDPKFRDAALKTIANGEFDVEGYVAAERAIEQVLDLDTISSKERAEFEERLAVSIFKQAESYRDNGQLLKAAEEFARVGTTVPNAKVRANAEFDAGVIFMDLEDWSRAAAVLEGFRRAYPGHTLSKDIPLKLAVAYENIGDFGLAAAELSTVATQSQIDNPSLARQASWQAAEFQIKADNPSEAINLYKKYVRQFPEPVDQQVEAQFQLVTLYDQTKQASKREYWLKQLIEVHKTTGATSTPRIQYLAAFASYELAEPAYQRFQSIPISQPLPASLERKKAAMQLALDNYTTTADIGVAEFLTASTYKIGDLYRVLARDLMASERPAGLNELELEQYEILLEEQALPFEDQAIEIFEANTERTVDKVYDQWVKNSFGALKGLLPGRYDKPERFESMISIVY